MKPIITLLLANVINVFFALTQNWNAHEIMFTTCAQTLIISLFYIWNFLHANLGNLYRFILLPAFVFTIGFSHLLYFSFLTFRHDINYYNVLIPISLFILNQMYDYFYYPHPSFANLEQVNRLMKEVIYRIMPMNFILFPLILLPSNKILLLLFMSLKAIFDIVSQNNQRQEASFSMLQYK